MSPSAPLTVILPNWRGHSVCRVCSVERPERIRVWTAWYRCSTRLAGESPAAVSAGAPRSRLQASSERVASMRSVESPAEAVRSRARGANLRAEYESVNFAAP